ncbi:MAG: hypothetical protein ACTHKQ_01805, partial [Mesorhizobium sp.]
MGSLRNVGVVGLFGYTILFFTFIYLPIVLIVAYSFNSDPINMMNWSGFTFDWYRQIFGLKNTV